MFVAYGTRVHMLWQVGLWITVAQCMRCGECVCSVWDQDAQVVASGFVDHGGTVYAVWRICL